MTPELNNAIALIVAAAILLIAAPARAIDFYEIQIYPTETTPPQTLELELHSNSVTTATGAEAHKEIRPYEIHETVEASYGLTPHIEVGQYLCTAKLDNGNYEYAGSRTKMHFGVAATDDWPIRLGGNIELDYMRRAAEEDPLSLELRPIAEANFGKFTLIANFAFEKPFEGPGTHRGMTLAPSGELTYEVFRWLEPGVEYYGDMGALTHLPGVQRQQHFIVPALNLPLLASLELNLGVGIGLTHASNGTFIKSIVGWQF
ncbi:MAG TPA: hypothetical protein VKS22_16545 [Candidatus Binataceae bacterium]|nr:hypothetical protein [Candidatus Binataceae bacterium]